MCARRSPERRGDHRASTSNARASASQNSSRLPGRDGQSAVTTLRGGSSCEQTLNPLDEMIGILTDGPGSKISSLDPCWRARRPPSIAARDRS